MKTLLSTLTLMAVVITTSLSVQAPDFSPNHDIVLCGPNDVFFVCTSPLEPENMWWDFGDGTTATGLNPVHLYSTTGVYDVKLVVEKNGIKDSITKTAFVTVNPKPEAKFEKDVTQTLDPFKRKFKFTGFSNAANISSYAWKVNDTLVASSMNLVYEFPRTDWFVVSLDIQNNVGCTDSYQDSIFINGDVINQGLRKLNPADDFIISTDGNQQQLRIEQKSGNEKGLTAIVYDITGRKELQVKLDANQKVWTVDISSLHGGVHIIEVSNQSYVAVKRLHKYMQ